VVVIDDDHWKRTAMAGELAADPRVEVVDAIDQDTAVLWPPDRWTGVDMAIVDVFDENAPSEIGTDVYSGIAALDKLRDLPVRTLAITPHCQHPLIQLRIYQSGADWLYHRWEINGPDKLLAVVLDPDADHVPQRPDDEVLRGYGARRAQVNESVRLYLRSPFNGLLRSGTEAKDLEIPRRVIQRFRIEISDSGYDGTEMVSNATRIHKGPRWPDVRDYLLTLLGRRGTPATEADRDDGSVGHVHP